MRARVTAHRSGDDERRYLTAAEVARLCFFLNTYARVCSHARSQLGGVVAVYEERYGDAGPLLEEIDLFLGAADAGMTMAARYLGELALGKSDAKEGEEK